MSTLKQTLPTLSLLGSSEAEQWQAFKREMAEQAEAHITALQLTDPKQIYLTAHEEISVAYQERLHLSQKQCEPATIIEMSVITTHSYLSKRSPYGLLYTLGYGMFGASPMIEEFVRLGVIIYDIRFSPRSRVHKWRKPFLREWLGDDNYVHLPALGNIHYNDDQPIELADPAIGIPLVAQLLRERKHIALMCVCKEHEECHRSDAADKILVQIPGATLIPLPSL